MTFGRLTLESIVVIFVPLGANICNMVTLGKKDITLYSLEEVASTDEWADMKISVIHHYHHHVS
jgi:hypothetical protein